MTLEKSIESYFVKRAKQHGAWALKFVSPGTLGVPDRIVLFMGGIVEFVELKKPGEKLRPSQKVVKRILERFGFIVTVIDNKEGVDEYWSTRRAR